MDQTYWLERERESIAHGHAATLSDVRLIHYELARGYSIKAANAGTERPARAPPKRKRNAREQLATAFPCTPAG